MNNLEINEVITKLRPSFATIITLIDESLKSGVEGIYRLDKEYKLVVYTPEPLGNIIVHVRPHLAGDRWAKLIPWEEVKLYEPSISEVKRFYASRLRVLGVCGKVRDTYWMKLLVKTRVTKKATVCDSRVINLGG